MQKNTEEIQAVMQKHSDIAGDVIITALAMLIRTVRGVEEEQYQINRRDVVPPCVPLRYSKIMYPKFTKLTRIIKSEGILFFD